MDGVEKEIEMFEMVASTRPSDSCRNSDGIYGQLGGGGH